jgi:hypothetical protein
MADYYPLINKAVAGLDKNTGEARRALYERARTALVAQLRGMDPPLTESEITRERLALEEAIRKIEAESARRPRIDAPQPKPAAAKPGAPTPAEPSPAPPAPGTPAPAERTSVPEAVPDKANEQSPAPPPEKGARGNSRNRNRNEKPPLVDEGLKGFRDVVAEAETLGEATAQAARSAREAYAAVPGEHPEFDRMEPRTEPEGLRSNAREHSPFAFEPTLPPAEARPSPPRAQMPRQVISNGRQETPPRSRRGIVLATLVFVMMLALGAIAYWQRDSISNLFEAGKVSPPPAPVSRETVPQRPKITDRVGAPQEQAAPAQPRSPADTSQPAAAVAQRVVLYEEDPADPQGKQYVGTAVWRTETIPAGPGKPPEVAIRADVEIPERRMMMTFSIRRNTDQALPASHTIEVTFTLPADFPFGGIANVPGILMKPAEQTRGAPLAGLAVKVTSGFFLVGLSAVDTDMQRNLQLLKERPWFDIPIVYNNGRRAILAIEKGTPGERAFNEAFAAWGQ